MPPCSTWNEWAVIMSSTRLVHCSHHWWMNDCKAWPCKVLWVFLGEYNKKSRHNHNPYFNIFPNAMAHGGWNSKAINAEKYIAWVAQDCWLTILTVLRYILAWFWMVQMDGHFIWFWHSLALVLGYFQGNFTTFTCKHLSHYRGHKHMPYLVLSVQCLMW